MKAASQRFSEFASKGRQGFKQQFAWQAIAAFLNLAAIAAFLYMLLPPTRASHLRLSFEMGIFSALNLLLGVQIFQFVILHFLKRRWRELEDLSMCDKLTGTFNLNYFEELLEEEVRRAGRYRTPLSVCLLDLDDFESYNEQFGRWHGDDLLRRFSRFLRGSVRATDGVARDSNDEFFVLLPHTDLVQAEKFLTRLLLQAEERVDSGFCAGVALYRTGEDKSQVKGRARLALQQAKKEGKRNIRCLIAGDDSRVVLSF